jgi:acetyl esterase/lipase
MPVAGRTDEGRMAAASRRLALVALAVLTGLLGLSGVLVSPAAAKPLSLPPLLKPKPLPAIAPVAPPISADPSGVAPRGTMIMIHAGGWAGHDAHAQQLLMDRPGDLLLGRGWRVVSLDYEEGTAGLQDVLDAAGAELARGTGGGPVCLYGESAGAQLALVAAARLRAIDCVIGLGTPTDLALYQSEAAASPDARLKLVASQMTRFFGAAPSEFAPWDPVDLAPSIHADVMLMHEADDPVVSALHDARFQAARPTTQLVDLAAGNPADPATEFMHGTVSDAGRGQYMAAIGAFADRAVAAREAERSAAATGCAGVGRSLAEVGLSTVKSALRCLARKDAGAGSARGWQRTSVTLRGEVNASRIWSSLRATKSGRRALAATAAKRAKVSVRAGDRTQVVLRAAR